MSKAERQSSLHGVAKRVSKQILQWAFVINVPHQRLEWLLVPALCYYGLEPLIMYVIYIFFLKRVSQGGRLVVSASWRDKVLLSLIIYRTFFSPQFAKVMQYWVGRVILFFRKMICFENIATSFDYRCPLKDISCT